MIFTEKQAKILYNASLRKAANIAMKTDGLYQESIKDESCRKFLNNFSLELFEKLKKEAENNLSSKHYELGMIYSIDLFYRICLRSFYPFVYYNYYTKGVQKRHLSSKAFDGATMNNQIPRRLRDAFSQILYEEWITYLIRLKKEDKEVCKFVLSSYFTKKGSKSKIMEANSYIEEGNDALFEEWLNEVLKPIKAIPKFSLAQLLGNMRNYANGKNILKNEV